jgi:hypothetical protein
VNSTIRDLAGFSDYRQQLADLRQSKRQSAIRSSAKNTVIGAPTDPVTE